MSNERFKVTITWEVEDIKSLRPNWSEDKCEEVLGEISGQLEDRSIELGWEVIEDLLNMDYEDEEEEVSA